MTQQQRIQNNAKQNATRSPLAVHGAWLAAALAASATALAQPASAEDLTVPPAITPSITGNKLITEHVIVTGQFQPQPASQVTHSVTQIDREQLTAKNPALLLDALRDVPGILVNQQGGAGGTTSVSVRGAEPNYTQVLIDGVAVNDTTNSRGGSFDFSTLSVTAVDRIEIARGPQSAVYGAGALAGVINIITLPASQGHAQRFQLEGGENGFERVAASAHGNTDALSYSFALSATESGEHIKGSERELEEYNGVLQWRPSKLVEMDVGFRKAESDSTSYPEQSGGPERALSNALDTTASIDQSQWAKLGLGTSALNAQLLYSEFDREADFDSPGILPFTAVPPNEADSDYQRDDMKFNVSATLASLTLTAGFDRRQENGESIGSVTFIGPTNFDLQRETKGYFFDAQFQSEGGLIVEASARRDDANTRINNTDENSEKHHTQRLAIKAPLSERLFFRASAAKGFKLPSFFALGHPLVGNANLDAERALTRELGVDWSGGSWRLSTTYFDNEYRDLIDFDSQLFTNVNRRLVETKGGEAAIEWYGHKSLALNVSATYTDIDSPRNLTERPKWLASIGSQWQINHQLSLNSQWRWVDERFGGTVASGEEVLDSYDRLDVSLTWAATEQWSVVLSVNNVLDEDYEEAPGFGAASRWLRLGVRYANDGLPFAKRSP